MVLYIGKHDFLYSVDYHRHEYIEFVYCTSGSGRFVTHDGQEVGYEKGDLVIVPSSLEHANLSGKGFSNYYLAIDRFDNIRSEIWKVRDNDRGDLLSVLGQCYYHFNTDSPFHVSIMTALSELLVLYINNLSGEMSTSKYTNMIKEDIISNYADPKYFPDSIYDKLPYSREYAVKKFKKETGLTPKEFLMDHRLRLAGLMLKERPIYDLSIKEIASACGFSDPLYLSRLFKSRKGMSPKKYSESS